MDRELGKTVPSSIVTKSVNFRSVANLKFLHLTFNLPLPDHWSERKNFENVKSVCMFGGLMVTLSVAQLT